MDQLKEAAKQYMDGLISCEEFNTFIRNHLWVVIEEDMIELAKVLLKGVT